PYATTYYANGYEYVPNYIPPVVYYTPTYDGYGGGYSYFGGYAYSSGGYSNSNVAYYPNYVPQSAYYSKEAQLVAEEGGNNSSKVNYSTDKEDNSLLNFGESVCMVF
ncbi:cell wall anchor protein, partial [Lactococcus lactis]|nr:cell wall anchor protein [Lactococcus lactis]MDT2891547.1 cell wall anchor protein [Lactococcus lactis]MDT2893866.1 cell wall anchor protein [Lactococcus lactis]MDT2913029.1 cell wall anchor protein [Lactococcus lactis]MDT2918033.1 cell wall anchor protein [Lactococcus lactis]